MIESTAQGSDGAQVWQARAAAYELLALSFAYPTDELVGALVSGEWADAAREMAGAIGCALPEGWGACLDAYSEGAAEDVTHELRVEATRLLVGAPKPVVSPYEGVWRAADDGVAPLLYVNRHSMDVERSMRACGLGRPEGTNDPVDRVDTELEFLEYLCTLAVSEVSLSGSSPTAVYQTFLDRHALVWMPRFAEAVARDAREPFYRTAADLLRVVLGC
ncbi:MAG: molecular chaperone TorD family protein [Coriobacteriia bacterium]|nr:molecular chaperone TorD family protein [Coriobacteriia bacterium]MBS5477909.1 molecular chaperone TorD family protein [Coriobacteriia bacterium]